MPDFGEEAKWSCQKLEAQLKLDASTDDILIERTNCAKLLSRILAQRESLSSDVGVDEVPAPAGIEEKAAVISRYLSVGSLSESADLFPKLKILAESFEHRIVGETSLQEFKTALDELTEESKIASAKAAALQQELEHKKRLQPLMLDFESLLNALAAPNLE